MKKKKLFVPALLTGLLTSPLISPDSINAQSSTNNSNQVDISVIKNVVSNFSYSEDLLPDVEITELNNFDKIYDFSDNQIGYSFNLIDGDKQYYIVASSNLELDPILSFGEGEFANSDSKEEKIYYNGGFTVKTESELNEEVLVDTLNNETDSQDNTVNKIKIKEKHGSYFNYDIKNKKNWDTYKHKNKNASTKNTESGSLTTLYTPSNYSTIYADRYYQNTSGVYNNGDSACGPTTGAMFAEYLKTKKGYKIDGLAEHYNSVSFFINSMYRQMNTSIAGTLPSAFAAGLHTHLEHRYPFADAWKVPTISAYGNFPIYKEEIGYWKFPVALYFEKQWGTQYAAFNYHYVLGVSYSSNSDGMYFGVKDPDGSTSSTKYYKWTDNNQYMTMIKADFIL
ncbi:hypothetical protein [Exiguobacterium aestuarii]|uniref:hypothetical protein n=1 Tax=Exiguobacterium aestuarii TaxID=273527 RepID=UPI001CD57C15|nr:hypothetical protein [Exiguobacterium aestuarii]MCA0979718.1 hypothetical protein [Exiguobacterium aestuarii]